MAHKDNFGEIKNVKEDYHDYLTDIMHCMNSNARKTASYKYVFFKSILDNLFNVNENLEISFDDLSKDFSIIYWNIIAKYKLPQYQNGRQSKMEKYVYQFISSDEMVDEVDFYSLKEDIQEEYLQVTKNVISINVVGALYSDFNEVIYGFDIKRKVIWFNKNTYRFLIEYKSSLEKLNYYAWILWIENILRIRDEEASNLATKLECSNKRKSLERFKDELRLKGDEEKCFYCGSKISICNCHLDHFIPWSFVHDDKIWNLVYSCSSCNTSKNDRIPNDQFLLKIQGRNKVLLNNSYEQELNRLYNAALHNGFACWEKRNK